MASIDLSDLIPEFRLKVERLLNNCRKRGIEMRPYQTLRDPFEQARLWRQSRTKEEIVQKIKELQQADADFLAYCLESVGPQYGDLVTFAPPGLSWHQWGEAVDSLWVVNGKAEWSENKKVTGMNGYRVYGEEARKLRLTSGGFWSNLKDWPHVQLRSVGSPIAVLTIKDINDEMKNRFGNQG